MCFNDAKGADGLLSHNPQSAQLFMFSGSDYFMQLKSLHVKADICLASNGLFISSQGFLFHFRNECYARSYRVKR